MIEGENINETDAEDLLITAWFHDVGYIKGTDKHEEKGVVIAKEYLQNAGFDEDRITKISQLIPIYPNGPYPAKRY